MAKTIKEDEFLTVMGLLISHQIMYLMKVMLRKNLRRKQIRSINMLPDSPELEE